RLEDVEDLVRASPAIASPIPCSWCHHARSESMLPHDMLNPVSISENTFTRLSFGAVNSTIPRVRRRFHGCRRMHYAANHPTTAEQRTRSMDIGTGLTTSDLAGVPERAKQFEGLGYDIASAGETSHDPFFPLLLGMEHTERMHFSTLAIAFPRSPYITANM